MKITLIAAADENWGIGLKQNLPWHIPEDLKHFKQRTMDKDLLVGRVTKETLPPLKGRRIHTLSRGDGNFNNLQSAFDFFKKHEVPEILIAGGANLYKNSLEYCEEAEISRIKGVYECDTFMPNLHSLPNWKLIEKIYVSSNLEIEKWKNTCIKLN